MATYEYVKFDICDGCGKATAVSAKGRHVGLCFKCILKRDNAETGGFILACMRAKKKGR